MWNKIKSTDSEFQQIVWTCWLFETYWWMGRVQILNQVAQICTKSVSCDLTTYVYFGNSIVTWVVHISVHIRAQCKIKSTKTSQARGINREAKYLKKCIGLLFWMKKRFEKIRNPFLQNKKKWAIPMKQWPLKEQVDSYVQNVRLSNRFRVRAISSVTWKRFTAQNSWWRLLEGVSHAYPVAATRV